jgi:hypothetical protein
MSATNLSPSLTRVTFLPNWYVLLNQQVAATNASRIDLHQHFVRPDLWRPHLAQLDVAFTIGDFS